MTIKVMDAIIVVYNLAEKWRLDAEMAIDLNLTDVYTKQMEALKIVSDMIDTYEEVESRHS